MVTPEASTLSAKAKPWGASTRNRPTGDYQPVLVGQVPPDATPVETVPSGSRTKRPGKTTRRYLKWEALEHLRRLRSVSTPAGEPSLEIATALLTCLVIDAMLLMQRREPRWTLRRKAARKVQQLQHAGSNSPEHTGKCTSPTCPSQVQVRYPQVVEAPPPPPKPDPWPKL